MFTFGHRPETAQRVALGADRDGTLVAIIHEAVGETSQHENYVEIVVNWSGLLYKCDNVRLDYKLARLDLHTPLDMRAPGAATGVPRARDGDGRAGLRARHGPARAAPEELHRPRRQTQDKPFSSKELRACFAQGAERFGWAGGRPSPARCATASTCVGWGMATGVWDAMQGQASAKAVLSADGKLVVGSATADIGTGTYTVMTQIAADTLGLPLEDVTFKLGDSSLPESPVEGGSWTVVQRRHGREGGLRQVREQLLKLAQQMADEPLRRPREIGRRGIRATATSACKADPLAPRRHRRGDAPRRHADASRRRRGRSRPRAGDSQYALDALRGLRGGARGRGLRHGRASAAWSAPSPPAASSTPRRPQPDHRRGRLGHRHGAAGGNVHRPQARPVHEPRPRRVSHPGERRHRANRRDLRRGARRRGQPARRQGRRRDRHRRRRRRRSPTPSSTPRASASATCRSRWTSCSESRCGPQPHPGPPPPRFRGRFPGLFHRLFHRQFQQEEPIRDPAGTDESGHATLHRRMHGLSPGLPPHDPGLPADGRQTRRAGTYTRDGQLAPNLRRQRRLHAPRLRPAPPHLRRLRRSLPSLRRRLRAGRRWRGQGYGGVRPSLPPMRRDLPVDGGLER